MFKKSLLSSLVILLAGVGIAYGVYATGVSGKVPFRLGLDLRGGSHLVYQADLSQVPKGEQSARMDTLRRKLEDRVNGADVSSALGVGENVVQVEGGDKIIIELPGVTDPGEANKKIGQTFVLEFREEKPGVDPSTLTSIDDFYRPTGLTGEFLKGASPQFDYNGQPYVELQFNKEGGEMFREITKRNVGKTLAVYLDGILTQAPVVQSEIIGGTAIITGVTAEEAKARAEELDFGALPVPIQLASQDTVGPSLGADAIDAAVNAGIIGLIAIMFILIIWYRIPGIIASLALGIYTVITLALFKFIPVTLTAPGLAGFVISLGMAVDANILIFERMKEELRDGKTLLDAVAVGFQRAWLSIRDGNVSSLISAVVLYGLGTTLIKSFALTFGIGVFISMFSAIFVSRIFLKTAGALLGRWPILFQTGVSK